MEQLFQEIHQERNPYFGGVNPEPIRPNVDEALGILKAKGKELAQGKPYTTSRDASVASGNPDSDGRELTNGFIIAPTDYMRDKSVQAATAFWDAGEPVSFVVDLGSQVRMAGVRVSTHQPDARFCQYCGRTFQLVLPAKGFNLFRKG